MTTRLCICDIDGVVANSEARFAKAEEAKVTYLDDMARNDLATGHKSDWNAVKQEATSLYWQTAFTPELVELDTLIEGAVEVIDALQYQHGYKIVFLTSRPETMREATTAWLAENGLSLQYSNAFAKHFELFMKAPAFQYVKTVTWKAGMVQTLAALYRADDVVFIDDEIANCQEVMKYQPIPLCFQSLAEAMEKL